MAPKTEPVNTANAASAAPVVNPLVETPTAPLVTNSELTQPAPTNVVETKNPVPKSKPGMVEVPAETLQQLLNRIESLEKVAIEHESTFDQDQMQKIERLRASGKLVQSVRLSFFDDKLVTSYKMTMNDVYIDNTGKEQSVQRIRLNFEDGTNAEVPHIDFFRRRTQRSYEVIRDARDGEGVVWKTCMLEGGKEITINAEYVN